MSNDEWQTPPSLFTALNADPVYGRFNLDPCCTENNCLCVMGLAVDLGYDGLKESWSDYSINGERVRAFMNPPYSRGNIGQWTAKARREAEAGRVAVAGLIKADPSTLWWQRDVMQASVLLFCDRRVRFIDPSLGKPTGSPTFASCIAIWDARLPEYALDHPVPRMWGWSNTITEGVGP